MNDSRDDYDYGPGFLDTCGASEFLSFVLAAALAGAVITGVVTLIVAGVRYFL